MKDEGGDDQIVRHKIVNEIYKEEVNFFFCVRKRKLNHSKTKKKKKKTIFFFSKYGKSELK